MLATDYGDKLVKRDCHSSSGRSGSPHFAARLSLVIAAGLLLSLMPHPALHAAPDNRQFQVRYTANIPGSITLIGNVLLRCDPNTLSFGLATKCAEAQAGTGSSLNNNEFNMIQLDVDADGSTVNSSSAALNLPSGASVLFAGLYWGAFSNLENAPLNPQRQSAVIDTPLPGGYITVTASHIDDITIPAQGNAYQAFADVTSLVREGGNGTYTVGNVVALTGTNRYAGWALVAVYQDTSQPLRNLVAYDGFLFDAVSKTRITVPLSNFVTPPSGPVTTTVGIVGYDGDRGDADDSALLNGKVLSDTANPANNMFNSTISQFGVLVTSRNPTFSNTMGLDIDLLNANDILANSATTATIEISANEKILPGIVTFATDIYQPVMTIRKTAVDLNGGTPKPGDVLEYAITMTNTGALPALQVVVEDTIPANSSYQAGTLQVVSSPAGAQVGSKTDASGDDVAEFTGSKVIFRLGNGATSSAGGTFNVGDQAEVRFRVKVADAIANGTTVLNKAVVNYAGSTTAGTFPLSNTAQIDTLIVYPDLSVSLSAPAKAFTGGAVAFVAQIANIGGEVASNVSITQSIPSQLTNPSVSASGLTCSLATNVSCSTPTIGPDASTTITLAGSIPSNAGVGQLTSNVVATTSQEYVLSNNSASATVNVQQPSSSVWLPTVVR